jgi:hypothetical protein
MEGGRRGHEMSYVRGFHWQTCNELCPVFPLTDTQWGSYSYGNYDFYNSSQPMKLVSSWFGCQSSTLPTATVANSVDFASREYTWTNNRKRASVHAEVFNLLILFTSWIFKFTFCAYHSDPVTHQYLWSIFQPTFQGMAANQIISPEVAVNIALGLPSLLVASLSLLVTYWMFNLSRTSRIRGNHAHTSLLPLHHSSWPSSYHSHADISAQNISLLHLAARHQRPTTESPHLQWPEEAQI